MVAESKVWQRLLGRSWDGLDARAARAVLKLRFAEDDRRRVDRLIQRSKDDALSARQRVELDAYLQVGRVLTMMHSRARQALGGVEPKRPVRRKVS